MGGGNKDTLFLFCISIVNIEFCSVRCQLQWFLFTYNHHRNNNPLKKRTGIKTKYARTTSQSVSSDEAMNFTMFPAFQLPLVEV